jgi:hypothetical protein
VKGAANHWWLIAPPDPKTTTPDLLIKPWSVNGYFAANVEHYCGSACVQKRVALFMTEKR